MPRIGLGVDNLLTSVLVGNSTPCHAETPLSNVLIDVPGLVAAHPGIPDGGAFAVEATETWIDTDAGNVQVTARLYTSAAAFAAAVQSALSTVLSSPAVYLDPSGRWRIEAASTFQLLWSSGAHAGSNLADVLGFAATDLTGATAYTGAEVRMATETVVCFDAGASVSPDAVAVILDGDDDATFSDVRIYGFSFLPALHQSTRAKLAAGAAVSATVSARGAEEENTIQLARPSGSARYWFLSWVHRDEGQRHEVGIVRGYAMLSSSTRTVRALAGHALVDAGDSIGISNYHPAPVERWWRLPLRWDLWEIADVRAVWHTLARLGRDRACLVCLRWAGSGGVLDGTLAAGDEADRGYLLWASCAEGPADAYSGQGSDYASGDVVLEQVP